MSVLRKFLKLLRPVQKSKDKGSSKAVKEAISKAFNEYLLFTNVFSSAILMLIGDFVQQEVEYHFDMLPHRYDYPRMARMVTVGMGYGVFHHYFYTRLDRLWPTPNLICTVKKILADQLTMSPLCIVYFFYFAGLLEGKDLDGCKMELKEKFWDVYIFDWILWPPTQFINFLYIPAKYQVFYINSITMFYDVFLSYIKHREQAHDNYEHLKHIDEVDDHDSDDNVDNMKGDQNNKDRQDDERRLDDKQRKNQKNLNADGKVDKNNNNLDKYREEWDKEVGKNKMGTSMDYKKKRRKVIVRE